MKTIRRPQRSKRERFKKTVRQICDGNKVIVEDGNFERAFKIFKKKTKKSGVIQECRKRRFYVSKGEKERLAKKAATRRYQKARMVE